MLLVLVARLLLLDFEEAFSVTSTEAEAVLGENAHSAFDTVADVGPIENRNNKNYNYNVRGRCHQF